MELYFVYRMFWRYCCLPILTLCELAILIHQKTGNKPTPVVLNLLIIQNIFSQFRYAAYRASSCYIWGKMGSRNRKPLPACLG
jgi:hypothetical protein